MSVNMKTNNNHEAPETFQLLPEYTGILLFIIYNRRQVVCM